MWPYFPELLATPVPRYTSYPTAAEFRDRGNGGEEMAQALEAIEAETPLSLYLHIPYCHEICWYCGCNTGAANRPKRLASYLDALDAEIDLVAHSLSERGKVARIAFGGGSPNAIGAADFLELVERLKTRFDAAGATLSVELDPRALDIAWIGALGAAGVRRVSLGVQTLAPHVQEAIGRVQPAAMIGHAVRQLRKARVESINFDLMYGLPGQSLEDLRETLSAVRGMAPERIALFGYAHVPHLIPRQRRIDEQGLPDSTARFRQAEFGHRFLLAAGYEPVGFDHFALPGDALARAARGGTLRRNFQGFTEDRSDILIGLGASAISSFPDRLLQNEKNAGKYRMLVSAGRLPVTRGLVRSADDRRRAAVIEALLCRGEADAQGLADLAGVRESLRPFEEKGLLAWAGTRLKLAGGAIPYARTIAAAFDACRQPQRRFSNAI